MNTPLHHIIYPARGSSDSFSRKSQTKFARFGKIVALLGFILISNYSTGIAQSSSSPSLSQSAYLSGRDQLERALLAAEQKLVRARSIKAYSEEGELLHEIGIIYKKLENSDESLKYLLWSIMAFEKAQEQNKILEVKRDLGDYYYKNEAHQKAIQYYEAYIKGKKRLNQEIPDLTTITQKLAHSSFILEDYEQAETTYIQVINLYRAEGNLRSMAGAYQALADINKQVNNINSAIQYLGQVEKISRQQKDTLNLLKTLNNLGFLYKRNKNIKIAINYFQQALEIPVTKLENQQVRVSMLTNLGVAYTNLGFFSRAKDIYHKALVIERKSGDIVGQAKLYNYLASNAYMSQNNAQALKMAEEAIELGVRKNAYHELAESYHLVTLIYESDQNAEKAEIYRQSYADIKGRIKAQRKKEQQRLFALQESVDIREEYLKSSIIEQEQVSLERERQENAIKLKEKELTLLKKNQALQKVKLLNQQLANEQAEQHLAIAKQALLSEKQKRELIELQRLQERQSLQLEQNLLEQEKQEKAIALLEAERKLQQQKLLQEAKLRKYGYGIILSFLAIIGVVSYSFVQKKKNNQKLQKQQVKIQEQNEHLKASEQMLMSSVKELEITQTALQKQKKKLEIENYKTQESLQYAKRIQFSMLPSERESQTIFPDSFVIFRPKDVVSGDFYWISGNSDYRIASVIDCTGHGVPGALVSLIAYNMLNEAIQEKNLVNPADILHYLNQQVNKRLRVGDNSVQDGMDIGICSFQTNPDRSVNLRYIGAKHTLYLVRGGKLEVHKGIRKAVGSIPGNIAESEYQLALNPGDSLYLTTDGFIDQSNPKRKRFGSRQLKKLIQEWNHLPMKEQHLKFINALETHQQSSEQRDDINLIGIKF